jgi:hypothetical protein
VAKTRMVCPFSGRLCEECSLYRGRHYFLCFCKKYRGYLDGSGETAQRAVSPASGFSSPRRFEIPLIKPGRAIDPFDMIVKAGKEA